VKNKKDGLISGEEPLELLEMHASEVKRGFGTWKERVRGFAEKYKRLGIDVDYTTGRVEVSRCDPDIDETKYTLIVFLNGAGTYIEFDSGIFEVAVKVAEVALDANRSFLGRLPGLARELRGLEILADREGQPPGGEANHRRTFEMNMSRDRETGQVSIHVHRSYGWHHDLEIALNPTHREGRITFSDGALDDAIELAKKWLVSEEEFLRRLPHVLKRYLFVWIVITNKQRQ
jgi:hypothetical protein